MKKWLLHIMFVSVLGMLAASCSQDADDPTQTADSRTAQVVFTLTLNKGNGSRAITNPNWNGTYDKEDGVGVDNLINNLQVLFFGPTDGKYIGNVQDAIFYEQSEGVYEFIGEISIDAGYVTTNANGTLNLNAKMMVLANCADITLGANSTYANVQALAYDGATSPSQIPMWGIQTINTPITVGARNELSDIDLLRAMAKVEVIMAAEGYTMENIILNRYNTKGYCAPGLGGSTWAAVGATADLATEGCTNYYTTATAENLTVAATDNKKVVFYIPECANSTDNPLSMYVNIKKGTTDVDANLTDANLYFKDYSDNSANAPFNIVRNHIYRYTITKVNDGFNLKVQVLPWKLREIDIDFTDIVTYNVTGWNQETINSINGATVYMTGGKDAEFVFDIVTPADLTLNDCQIGLTNNIDFSLQTVMLNDGKIKITIKALDTEAEYPKTSLYVYVKDKYGRNVELDLTGTGDQSTAEQENVNRYTIIQNW